MGQSFPARPWARLGARLDRPLVRYLAVGAWNTAFGYLAFAGFNWLLTGIVPFPYLAANVLANLVAISVAYVLYKFFVFRTKGNVLAEFLKMNAVYFATALVGLALLPVVVHLAGMVVSAGAAPYVAQAVLVPVATMGSYLGHRRFSFRSGRIDGG